MKFIALGIIGLLAIVATTIVSPYLVLTGVVLAVVIALLVRRIDIGLLILIALFPVIGLVVDFSTFSQFRDIPYLGNVNAPLIDLYGLLLFFAWGIVVLRRWISARLNGGAFRLFSVLPFKRSYSLFWLSALASLSRVPSQFFGASAKYLLRPFTYAYIIFLAVPWSILTRLTRDPVRLVRRAVIVLYGTGMVAAVNGLVGLLFTSFTDFPRATPYPFFGYNLLGPNHNLLAETLIATAPAGLLIMKNEELRMKNYVQYGMYFQWVIALLTFARTAWIAIALQAGLYLFFMYRGQVVKALRKAAPAVAVVVLLAVLLGATMLTYSVQGSTSSRFELGRIAYFYFMQSPWVGQGIGTFVSTLWGTKAFLLEFGEPLEAHGIIFKLMLEQGILGLLTFGIFVGSLVRTMFKEVVGSRGQRRTAMVAALMIATGSLVYQLFNTNYYSAKLWVPVALALAIVQVYRNELDEASLL